MTDCPRFQIVEHRIEDAHCRYHGGGLVAFALSCMDRWMAWRERRALARTEARPDPPPCPGTDPTQQSVGSARQSRAALLSALPVALAVAASLPADANAWGEFDVPSSKKSRLGRHVVAIDAYNIVRRASDHVLFLDVRTSPEIELLGIPRLIDANVPFLLYESTGRGDEQQRNGQLVTSVHFVRAVGERIAAKGLTPDSAIILICADGTRSARAADVLTEAGYSQVYTVIDGFEGDQVAAATRSGRRAANGSKLSRLPWFYPADQPLFQYTITKP